MARRVLLALRVVSTRYSTLRALVLARKASSKKRSIFQKLQDSYVLVSMVTGLACMLLVVETCLVRYKYLFRNADARLKASGETNLTFKKKFMEPWKCYTMLDQVQIQLEKLESLVCFIY